MEEFDPEAVTVPACYFVVGSRVTGTGEEVPVIRPSDAHPYGSLRECGLDDVDRAVESAWTAFRRSDWATGAPRQRAKVLRRWADLIEADGEVLGPLEAVGSTRPVRDVMDFDVPFTAEGIRFFAEFADKIGGDLAPTRSDSIGFTMGEPYGVVAAIAPWNFPLIMASWKIAPALAAGNAVVLKPSELTPFSAVRLAELAIASGMPPGILNIVQGRGAVTGDALCRHPKVGKITFTGSTGTGRAIMIAAAESGMKPVTLELGGKSPQLVFPDVPDLGLTAASIARGIAGNAGQVCVAGSRLIAHERIAEPLVELIVEHFRSLKSGATWRRGTTLSPLINEAHARKVEGIVDRSVRAGARIVTGGTRANAPQDGAFYLPTVLSHVTPDMPAVEEEIFGPVLTFQTFKEDEEGLALADHPRYGLAAGVHTKDFARAMRAVRRLEVGTVWINRYGRSGDFILPTGGYKQSGLGKDLGRAAFEASLRMKTVLADFG